MKKLFLSLLTVLLPMVAFADAVEIDGIYYNLVSKANAAEVTSNPNKYSGSVNIPASVLYNGEEYSVIRIMSGAFKSCNSLTSVVIPNSVTSIGESTFRDCSNLTSVTISNQIESIGSAVFYHCSSLASITIPNSVTSIGSSAFNGCKGLTSITIPNSVTDIQFAAFSGCSGLTSISIPNSITSLSNSIFSGCSGLTSIKIPNSVKTIAFSAFHSCIGLISVTIPNSVQSIGYDAFRSCYNLSSVTIGSSVKTISSTVFADCPELTEVYCLAEIVPTTSSDAFKNSYIEHATLHVPAESVNKYNEEEPWKNFMSIVSLEGGTPETPKCAMPTISYKDGELSFFSETDDVEFVTDITDNDIKRHFDSKISLTATYSITVYATKSGYDNSDVATATLCWIDQQPNTEGITNSLAQIPARPVLIKTDRGQITVEGVEDHTNITLFTTDGKLAGSSISQNGSASIDTHLPSGTTAIVKIGEKSEKVLVK